MKNMAKALKALTIGITPFAGVIILLMAALAFTACPTGDSGSSGTSEKAVTKLDITVTAPVTGATPVREIPDNGEYKAYIAWTPAVTTFFAPEQAYTAAITLAVNEGFTLSGLKADSFKVNGNAAGYASGVVTFIFPATGPAPAGGPITAERIDGVTPPVTGATPVTAITPNAQFTGTVTWKDSNGASVTGAFAASTSYIATITLTPANTFTTVGIRANQFTVAGALTARNDADSGVITAAFPATGGTEGNPTVIKEQKIVIRQPAYGETPQPAVDLPQFSGTIAWQPDDETFGAKMYTAVFTLTPKTGFIFNSTTPTTGWDVTGAATTPAVSFTLAGSQGKVSATFAALEAPPLGGTVIEGRTITLSQKPATGGDPNAVTVVPTTEFTGTISWAGLGTDGVYKDLFASGSLTTVATIILTPNPGYKFEGLIANSFTIAGYDKGTTPPNPANAAGDSAIITFTVPKLDTTVNNLTIAGITAPAANDTNAAVSITDTVQYTGSVSWDPPITDVSGTFQPKQKYTATITLTARPGWTFWGVGEDEFTVTGIGAVAKNPKNTGVITVVYPTTAGNSPTDATVIDDLNIKLVGIKHGESQSGVTMSETTQYTIGPITWSPAEEKFVSGKVYTASFAVTASANFTLTGVQKNSFKVNGTETIHAADSGAVVVVLPAIPKLAIKDITAAKAAIAGVTVPAITVGTIEPETTIKQNPYFTGKVTWDPAIIGGSDNSVFNYKKFKPGTQYTARIVLTATTYYSLDGLPEKFFIPDGTITAGTTNSFITDGTNAIKYGNTAGLLVPPTATAPNPRYDEASKTVFVTFQNTEAMLVPSGTIDVTKPVTGATPATAVKATDYYTGSVQWFGEFDADGKFEGGQTYRAIITLEPKQGYTFTGVTAGVTGGTAGPYFTVVDATVTTNADSSVVLADFSKPTTSKIDKDITLPAPSLGEAPATKITGNGYTGTVAWSGNPVTFEAGQPYTATVTINLTTPDPTITLAGVGSDYFKLSANPAAPMTATVTNSPPSSNTATSITVTVAYSALASVVTTKAFGLATPVAGEDQVKKITETTNQFESDGDIVWSPSDSKYKGETDYVATINIKPKTGYTLTGIPSSTVSTGTGTGSSFFVLTPTVTGITTRYIANSASSGTIIITFPKTQSKKIDITVITGLTSPVIGGNPVAAITATDQFTGAVTWARKDSTGTTWDGSAFVPGIYTATVVLTATDGFTTSGFTASSNTVPSVFTVPGATSGTTVSNAAAVIGNSGSTGNFKNITITVVFPVLSKPVDLLVIPGLAKPKAGVNMDTSIDGNKQYTGTVTWRAGDGVTSGPAFTGTPTADSKYTAVIVLTPVANSGYTFTGVSKDAGFKIVDVEGTNLANSGTITVVCTADPQ